MKTTITITAMLILLSAIACIKQNAPVETKLPVADESSRIKRGEYLVNAMGCDDCHSPKHMTPVGLDIIPELRFSGHPADEITPPVDDANLKNGWILFSGNFTSSVGPWGQSFAANLTSDETGIGNWTEENFMRAIRHGKFKGLEGSRDLLPPMPWFVYKNLNDEDLKSIFAFLKSTPPVHNIVPAPIPPGELNKSMTTLKTTNKNTAS
jgi:cytochrome c553